MRVLIVSDIHANPWALRAVLADAGPVDHVLCPGDVVNYGPDPAGAIAVLRATAATAVRGNHDHAVAFAVDPRAAPAKQPLAVAMRDWTRAQLCADDMAWLVALPRQATVTLGATRFALFHATPVDPLYDYRLVPGIAEPLLDELTAGVAADVLLLGHTHLPLSRARRGLQIVNPGSAGQPLDGDRRAAYAVWQDGAVTLRRVDYDRGELNAAVGRLPLPRRQVDDLLATLAEGRVASASPIQP